MRRGFTITKDHLGPEYSREGWVILFSHDAPQDSDYTHEFQAYDDDGELYYEGLSTSREGGQVGDEDLWQTYLWMQVDSGVTRMEIRRIGTRAWEHYP